MFGHNYLSPIISFWLQYWLEESSVSRYVSHLFYIEVGSINNEQEQNGLFLVNHVTILRSRWSFQEQAFCAKAFLARLIPCLEYRTQLFYSQFCIKLKVFLKFRNWNKWQRKIRIRMKGRRVWTYISFQLKFYLLLNKGFYC